MMPKSVMTQAKKDKALECIIDAYARYGCSQMVCIAKMTQLYLDEKKLMEELRWVNIEYYWQMFKDIADNLQKEPKVTNILMGYYYREMKNEAFKL